MTDMTKHDSASTVTVDMVDERIARVRFANPARRHALDAPLLDALVARLDALAGHRPPPVVILSNDGSGDVWSAGHDLRELADDRDPLAYGKPLERALRRVRTYPGAVIAAVAARCRTDDRHVHHVLFGPAPASDAELLQLAQALDDIERQVNQS